MNPAPSTAVIYARVSTAEQTRNLSLETQEGACRDYCEREGFSVARVFVERGESAKTVNRPAFQEMLQFCATQRGGISVVVVYNLSRFARETYDHKVVAAYLRRFGIRLRSVTEPIDETPAGAFMETIFSAVAQLDNDMRADRTKVGMQAAMNAGRWPFAAPIGYQKGRDDRGKSNLVPDPERADHVRWIFQTYSNGLYTKRDVLEMANARGLRTPRGKPLAPQTLQNLLRNRLYTGWMAVEEWNLPPTRGTFEALIDEELFDRVQAVLSGRALSITPSQSEHHDFPLRDLVRCGACDRRLTGAWSRGRSKRYGYYRCWQRGCLATKVPKDLLERDFVGLLGDLTLRPEYLRLFRETVLQAWEQRLGEVASEARTHRQRVADLHKRRDQLEDAFLYQQAIDNETYRRQKEKLDGEIVVAEMAQRESRLDELDVEGLIGFAETLLTHPARLWAEFPLKQKLRFQRILFPNGLTYAEGRLGTVETPILFRLLRAAENRESREASPTGFEPVLPT